MTRTATRTPNVLLTARSRELRRQLAKEEQQSMKSVLDPAIEQYRTEKFLLAANADFVRMKRDAKACKQQIGDGEAWEYTLADGISKE